MKVCFTIGQKADGTYAVVYAGNDAAAADGAFRKLCEEPEGYIAVGVFRKPVPWRRRRFESEEANERWRMAAELKGQEDAESHEKAKAAAMEKAKADALAEVEAGKKAREEADARQKEDAAERAREVRRLEEELQAKAAKKAKKKAGE